MRIRTYHTGVCNAGGLAPRGRRPWAWPVECRLPAHPKNIWRCLLAYMACTYSIDHVVLSFIIIIIINNIINIYIYIYIHTHTHTHICIICVYIYIYTYVCIIAQVYIYSLRRLPAHPRIKRQLEYRTPRLYSPVKSRRSPETSEITVRAKCVGIRGTPFSPVWSPKMSVPKPEPVPWRTQVLPRLQSAKAGRALDQRVRLRRTLNSEGLVQMTCNNFRY